MWTRSSALWSPPSEDVLATAWADRLYAAHWLVDCCGRHLRVVYPGRRWGGPGPDFRGAVLADRSGALIRGDVEIHVRASAWARHGHTGDAEYARVILHVVAWADALVLDGGGEHIPTVVLEVRPQPVARLPADLARPCLAATPALLEVVRAAGRERFRARAARFEGDLAAVAPDQVVWRGVAEALGYARNAAAFGALADAVPWSLAAEVVRERGALSLAGLLLGSAGLLAEATLPEAHAWRALQRTHGVRPALGARAWDARQVRAANAPAMRCRGLAALADRWLRAAEPGPAAAVLDLVRRAAHERQPRLWWALAVRPWIGRGRAQVVAINVALPFAAAAGVDAAAGVFERAPGEPSNRILRYMVDQLGGSGAASGVRFHGACLQQGLLHLFRQTCAARVCEACPAARGARRRSSSTTLCRKAATPAGPGASKS